MNGDIRVKAARPDGIVDRGTRDLALDHTRPGAASGARERDGFAFARFITPEAAARAPRFYTPVVPGKPGWRGRRSNIRPRSGGSCPSKTCPRWRVRTKRDDRLSGLLLAATGYLFAKDLVSASGLTVARMIIFFFASSAASSAYVTVSETFPLEIRALAIAFFYAIGTGIGGVSGLLRRVGARPFSGYPWRPGSDCGSSISIEHRAGRQDPILTVPRSSCLLWKFCACAERGLDLDDVRQLQRNSSAPALRSAVACLSPHRTIAGKDFLRWPYFRLTSLIQGRASGAPAREQGRRGHSPGIGGDPSRARCARPWASVRAASERSAR